MAILPDGLNGVPADSFDPDKLKSLRRKRTVGVFVEIAHDVDLAFASGARTTATKFLQADEIFMAIVPFDGDFLADLLEVYRAHDLIL